ncbi:MULTISPECIES: AAA family ATPase [pseudomallei group]|uniref:AAA family ATPase n=1 Tax=pseudomallei group TaxID=111527 RepID=UPI00016AABE3|nr:MULTISPECIES: AAA family ATPase [pseudomallei group]AIV75342.1 AAA domain protein [Burkholderia pseudomallei]APY94895.1 DNA transposition protein [Burkholderia pseudomallei]KGC53598.1 AAA domain protein [Burkholderia pseudomallei]KGC58017.1 AAA domain protein [Burkholderia pseudomallei]KGD32539.1 AAA domain protein [Burkholderia pseudomallei]
MTSKNQTDNAVVVPVEWPEHYSEANRVEAIAIATQLVELGKTRSWLARLARVNVGTLSSVLNGRYGTDPTKWLRMMSDALATHTGRATITTMPHVQTSVSQMATVVCERARKYRNFGVLTGFVGVGKTDAVRQYKANNSHTIIIEANPNMSPAVMLDELRAELSAPMARTLDAKFATVTEALAGSTYLIVVDEAETMMPSCLHYLRRIRDKAGIGVVLVGTDRLLQLIKPSYGQFDQIRSRVGFWPQVIRGVSRDDADALAQAALDDQGELSSDVLDALWHYCRGSARMLIENFIPALRDYGLKKNHELSAELVHAVARDALLLGEQRNA